MVITAGQQRRARGRAKPRRVELTVGQTLAREPLGCWHSDEPAAGAWQAVTNVIQQHNDDVGRVRRRLVHRRKVGLRIAVGHSDLRIRKSVLWFRVDLASDTLRLLVLVSHSLARPSLALP